MNKQKIFLITPIGKKQTPTRQHADKMWNSVFQPLEKEFKSDNLKFEFVRTDQLPEGGESRIKRIMELIRESRGCIVDLYNINNLNVIYEIGLAHSQGKRVFFLRSDKIKEEEIPSDIRYYADYYYSYNLDIFEGEASSEEINNISKKVLDVIKAMILGDTNNNLYRPYFYQPTEQYVSTVLEEINEKINNLERLFT